jgi:sigma-B regulation protein RsbU (phosphoserine phosphatase)
VYPAKEVGGDFYDFFFIDDDHFAVIVADVSGKGVPAALFMAITKTLVKNHLQAGEDADLALENINRQLCNKNTADMFVTLWLGLLEISSGLLRYINAGHNPPLIKRGDSNFDFLISPPDLVLAGMDETIYRQRETSLARGDTLFLYTDGITEAENTAGNFYGKERLRAFLNSRGNFPVKELLPELRSDIEAFSGGAEQSDDITMLALRLGQAARITLKADTELLGELIGFIGREMEAAGCPEKVRGQIELAGEEIFVNIARYAYQNGEEGEVLVSCETGRTDTGTAAVISFNDRGRPFNPLEHAEPDIGLPLDKRPVGGLGLLMVKRTMDTVKYHYSNGTNHLKIGKSW